MCTRKQTTESKLLIMGSFFSGEDTPSTIHQLLHLHIMGSVPFLFYWATQYNY